MNIKNRKRHPESKTKNLLRFGGVLFAYASYIAVQLYLRCKLYCLTAVAVSAMHWLSGRARRPSPTDFVGDGALDVPPRKVISKSE